MGLWRCAPPRATTRNVTRKQQSGVNSQLIWTFVHVSRLFTKREQAENLNKNANGALTVR